MAEVVSSEHVDVVVSPKPVNRNKRKSTVHREHANFVLHSIKSDKDERERERDERLENIVDKTLASILTETVDGDGDGVRLVTNILDEYGYVHEQVRVDVAFCSGAKVQTILSVCAVCKIVMT